MPLVEVDQGEWETLQAQARSAGASKVVLDKILAGPNRMQQLKLVKGVAPDVAIPELDAAQPVLDEVGKVAKRFDDYIAAQEAEKAESRKAQREARTLGSIEEGRAYLRRQGYNAEGVAAVEEFIKTRGLADYEAAEALFAEQQPAEEPVFPSNYGKSWDLFEPEEGNDELKQILSARDPRAAERAIRKWSEKEARRTLDDIRNGRQAA